MRTLAGLVLLLVCIAAGAAYPEKPIRLVIPSAAGGSPDVLMRILAQQLSTQLGVPIVVENKPGASFVLGTMDVVKAPPDGYTSGIGTTGHLGGELFKAMTGSESFPEIPAIAEAVPGYETDAWGG